MKLEATTWHAKLYMNTYGKEDYDLPDNLCEYFWKLVLGVVLWPLNIIALPSNLMFRGDPDSEHHSIGERTAVGTLIWLALYIIFSAIVFLTVVIWQPSDWDNWYDFWKSTAGAGLISISVAILIGGYHGIKHLWKKWKILGPTKKEKSPSIVKEFIKAKKNKYCPHIEWDNLEEDDDY